MIRQDIEQAITVALTAMGAEGVAFALERPGSMDHGDYATNAALIAAKILKKNPKEVADELASNLAIEGIKKIEVAGPGFINFTLSGSVVKEVVHEAHGKEWGNNTIYKGKKVMVEYTDPNPFKQFHIGHLMSNAIGESIARALEHSGAEVLRANYQGDVGPHVAKALFVLLEKNIENPTIEDISRAYVEGATRYEEKPEDKLAIDALNKKIYDKTDERVNELYKKGRTLSLEHFEEIYKILGTKFDLYFFESETANKGLEIVRARPEIFEASEGAIVFHGEKYGLHTRVFINKLGLPTYEAKDLGLIVEKEQRGQSDHYIYVTANEQNEYFKVVFQAAGLVFPEIANKLMHRSHGMMRFAEGKMSSRVGNVITGESLLMDLMGETNTKMEGRELKDAHNTAQQVAVGAIKYAVLKQSSGKDIVFDPEKSLSLEGDSGPYVQYALVRARALLRNARSAKVVDPEPAGPMPIERLIVHFPQVVERTVHELEPHYVATYLTELAGMFNSWYASERLIVDGAITSRALAVVKAIENTLAQGLQVLGIPTPEEM
ncbi:MAG TPA: arginine--tRNA ligase [Candidatus Paceibacterota bacterium]|nr:arginine--tRNA ligase [Candidatus Paceibacterota bacterium]